MTADIVLTVIFSVEMFIRIIAMGFYDKESTDTYAKFCGPSNFRRDGENSAELPQE